MANVNSSFDEILQEIGDSFEEDIAPKKLVRRTTNHLWLIFRAFARGLYSLYQVLASAKYRYDPAYCSDDELESAMRIVGTERIQGKGSLLNVTFTNTTSTAYNLVAQQGTAPNIQYFATIYQFTSANSDNFIYKTPQVATPALTVPGNGSLTIQFISGSLGDNNEVIVTPGSYAVSDMQNAIITCSDTTLQTVINNGYLTVSIADNSALLGSEAETNWEVRQRLVADKTKDDLISYLQNKIKALQNVFDCKLIYNATASNYTVSGYYPAENVPMIIAPYKIMVLLNGVPDAESLAGTFMKYAPFPSQNCAVTEGGVTTEYAKSVTYSSPVYAGGQYSVYYFPYNIVTYTLKVAYTLNTQYTTTTDIEDAIKEATIDLTRNQQHIDSITSADIFDRLKDISIATMKVLSISFSPAVGADYVSYRKFADYEIARMNTVISFEVPIV